LICTIGTRTIRAKEIGKGEIEERTTRKRNKRKYQLWRSRKQSLINKLHEMDGQDLYNPCLERNLKEAFYRPPKKNPNSTIYQVATDFLENATFIGVNVDQY
jgi:hypothetical protein